MTQCRSEELHCNQICFSGGGSWMLKALKGSDLELLGNESPQWSTTDSQMCTHKSPPSPPQVWLVDTYTLPLICQYQSMYLMGAFKWIFLSLFLFLAQENTLCPHPPPLSTGGSCQDSGTQTLWASVSEAVESFARLVAPERCSPHRMWCRRLAGSWVRISLQGVRKKRDG